MEQILIARETAVKFYKRFEVFILPILKFCLGLFVFSRIHAIAQMHGMFEPFADTMQTTPIIWLFAMLFTVMPMSMGWMLIILNITMQFSANIEIAVAVFLFMMFIFLFYARMAQRESILILFTMLAFHFNVPYLVPILAGLYFPVTAIIPVTVGVFLYAQIDVVFSLMQPASVTATLAELELADRLTAIPDAFSEVYTALISSITASQTWLFTAIVFAMVIILVHLVSRQAIDFAKEIAIVLGGVVTIFGFVITTLVIDEPVRVGMVIFGTIICILLALLVRFFDGVLDYQRAESVTFEDDDNYYHVRIVPKVIMTKPKRVVKRIRPEAPPPFISDPLPPEPEAPQGEM